MKKQLGITVITLLATLIVGCSEPEQVKKIEPKELPPEERVEVKPKYLEAVIEMDFQGEVPYTTKTPVKKGAMKDGDGHGNFVVRKLFLTKRVQKFSGE